MKVCLYVNITKEDAMGRLEASVGLFNADRNGPSISFWLDLSPLWKRGSVAIDFLLPCV